MLHLRDRRCSDILIALLHGCLWFDLRQAHVSATGWVATDLAQTDQSKLEGNQLQAIGDVGCLRRRAWRLAVCRRLLSGRWTILYDNCAMIRALLQRLTSLQSSQNSWSLVILAFELQSKKVRNATLKYSVSAFSHFGRRSFAWLG